MAEAVNQKVSISDKIVEFADTEDTRTNDDSNKENIPAEANETTKSAEEIQQEEEEIEGKKVTFAEDTVTKDEAEGSEAEKTDGEGSESEAGYNPLKWLETSGSETDGEPIPDSMKKKMARMVKRTLRGMHCEIANAALEEIPTQTDVEEVENKIIERKEKKEAKKDIKNKKSYRYGRYMMITLALFSIPIDGWKCYEGVEKSERALEAPSAMEVFDFYSTTVATHVVGLAAAYEHNLFMTVAMRLISTYMYQKDYSSKGNSSVPTDPKELHKYIKENVPKHRLPKGYTFPKEDDEVEMPEELRDKYGKGGKGKKKKKMGKNKNPGKHDRYDTKKDKRFGKRGDSGPFGRSKKSKPVPKKSVKPSKSKKTSSKKKRGRN